MRRPPLVLALARAAAVLAAVLAGGSTGAEPGRIIHLKSARPYPFTLGQFFAVRGVRFTRSALGESPRPSVWVDGRPVADGPHYVLRAHDSLVIGVGPRGSFPTTVPVRFPPGL